MTREDVLQVLRDHEAELREQGVIHAALFGSLARGEADIHARARETLDHTLMQAALRAHDNHRQHAAAALGVGRNTLTRKLGASRTRRPNKA